MTGYQNCKKKKLVHPSTEQRQLLKKTTTKKQSKTGDLHSVKQPEQNL